MRWFAVMILDLVYGGAMGWVVYGWRKNRDAYKPDPEPEQRPEPEPKPEPERVLSKKALRYAADQSVGRRGWADTDRQTVPRQLSPAERPVGVHRLNR